MNEDLKLMRLTFLSFRLLFFSCWNLDESEGKWIAKRSTLCSVLNVSFLGILAYGFARILTYQNQPTIYKNSSIVFPLYTQFVIIMSVSFLICGNVYSKKFADILNQFPPVMDRLRNNFGTLPFPVKSRIKSVFSTSLICLGTISVFKFYLEFHLVLSYPRAFRIVYYYTFYYATFFGIHFLLTMEYAKENYFRLNLAFEKIISQEIRRVFVSEVEGNKRGRTNFSFHRDFEKFDSRRKLKIWMISLMELREVEDLVNEVFGKQIFLILLLGFSGIIINVYFFVTLNLYKTSNVWLNSCFAIGLFESSAVLLIIIRAAERTSQEANKINDEIFYFPLSHYTCCSYDRIKYLTMFLCRYPTQFKAWVFYTVSYSSFFKVVAASSAITIIFLQCEFMRSIKVN